MKNIVSPKCLIGGWSGIVIVRNGLIYKAKKMKGKFLLLACLLFSFYNLKAQDGPVMTFEVTKHDFGSITQDSPAVFTYKFRNTGNLPLQIDKVVPACGCTTPDWSKSEIKPGKSGFVRISFDPVDRPGTFEKTVTVFSNSSPPVKVLNFSGTVQPVKH